MFKPILKGPHVTLRSVKLSDAPNFVRWFSDKEVCRYVHPGVYKINLAEEKKYLRKMSKSKTDWTYAITAEDGAHVGVTSAHLNPLNKESGFGIIIGAKNYWGRGIAGECIRLLGDLVFNKLKYNRFHLRVIVENKRALTAYKKAGFKIEGRLREHLLSRVDEKFHDEYTMAILKKEWLKNNKLK